MTLVAWNKSAKEESSLEEEINHPNHDDSNVKNKSSLEENL